MTFEWERIYNEAGDVTLRAKVLGGWLVLNYVSECEQPGSSSTVFLPDKDHKWKVDK